MESNKNFTEKDIKIVKVNGKFGYQYPDGSWFAEPEFDEAFEFEDGYAIIVKEGLEGWICFDDGSAYCPWSQQERWLKENKRKHEKRNRILKIFALGPKPMDISWWDEDEHFWIVNKLHACWEKFKENPVIPVTIIFGTAVLIYTFFFE
ncbi:MAG: WG repeat-containing protein [Muribaculaceae bacterium]|nr:WG repeat-containing protein [Muribaculaceae bacterium]